MKPLTAYQSCSEQGGLLKGDVRGARLDGPDVVGQHDEEEGARNPDEDGVDEAVGELGPGVVQQQSHILTQQQAPGVIIIIFTMKTLIGAAQFPWSPWLKAPQTGQVDRTRIRSHTYINTVTTMWCEAPAQLLVFSACWVFSCFCQTLTWTAGSLTCVREHSCACVYTQQWGTDSTTFFTWKTKKRFVCSSRDSYNYRRINVLPYSKININSKV